MVRLPRPVIPLHPPTSLSLYPPPGIPSRPFNLFPHHSPVTPQLYPPPDISGRPFTLSPLQPIQPATLLPSRHSRPAFHFNPTAHLRRSIISICTTICNPSKDFRTDSTGLACFCRFLPLSVHENLDAFHFYVQIPLPGEMTEVRKSSWARMPLLRACTRVCRPRPRGIPRDEGRTLCYTPLQGISLPTTICRRDQ